MTLVVRIFVAIGLTSQTTIGTKFDMLEKMLQFMIVKSLDSHRAQYSELEKLFFADFE